MIKKILEWLCGDTPWYRNFLKERHTHKCEDCLNFKPIPKNDRDKYVKEKK